MARNVPDYRECMWLIIIDGIHHSLNIFLIDSFVQTQNSQQLQCTGLKIDYNKYINWKQTKVKIQMQSEHLALNFHSNICASHVSYRYLGDVNE